MSEQSREQVLEKIATRAKAMIRAKQDYQDAYQAFRSDRKPFSNRHKYNKDLNKYVSTFRTSRRVAETELRGYIFMYETLFGELK